MSEANPERRLERPKCPKCGSAKALPICYGFPDPEILEDAMEGKIVLGGCVMGMSSRPGTATSAVTNGGNYASTWLFYKKSRAMINAN